MLPAAGKTNWRKTCTMAFGRPTAGLRAGHAGLSARTYT